MANSRPSTAEAAEWEQYTAFPIDKRVVTLSTSLTLGETILNEGQVAFELSFSRRINNFEAHQADIFACLERLADDIVAGAQAGEQTPPTVLYYGPAEVGDFKWADYGFGIQPGAPLPGDMFTDPIDEQPLNDEIGSPRQVATIYIPTLDLLRRAGYEV